ncbi:GNAT family N-acetyltransferase [Saccharopolyspora taberi]|uniref:GNAT family N-acetyltransferase n=1 Tax=Saccharopolyspora taberi TaxID=60895 RepID=A0ABN3VJD6_9PSEU
MSDLDVRPVAESEFRDANSLFLRTLHIPPASDDQWERSSARYEPGRVLGAFVDGELAGTAMAQSSSLAVPGGAVLPAGAVTNVGVRADRTRRGALTALKRAQFADARERGEPLTMLHASEAVIYGRFGYGVATRARKVRLDRARAVPHPDVPAGGAVRLVDAATAEKVLPEVYRRIGLTRPGMMSRPDGWWRHRLSALQQNAVVVVHSDDHGVDDGFALYEAKANDYRFDDGMITIQVGDVQAADTTALAGLWRFLLELDMAHRIEAVDRPVNEPLEWWLTDRRQCRVTGVGDDLWLRLVDVPAALGARSFGAADPVVIAVRDPFLPENSGSYRIGPEAVRCADDPQLAVGVDVLASLYLGDVSVSELVAAGRVEVRDPAAVAAADRLFATAEPPWCGTAF